MVVGQANIWLAGMPNGTTIGADSAPTHSPKLVAGGSLAGQTFTFQATGLCGNGVPANAGPEGIVPNFSNGDRNGISGVIAPNMALIGVFLDNSLPSSTAAPAQLDFSSEAARDYTSLSPLLKQIFFIGDGYTSLDEIREVIAPAGATRLFLGTHDGAGGYWDNTGSFEVITNYS